MNGVQCFHALYFNEYAVGYYEVRSMLSDDAPLVQHRNSELTCVRQISFSEFHT